MRVLKSTVTARGIDTYFIPDEWGEIKNVYLVPFLMVNAMRTSPESAMKRYSVEFAVLPPDRTLAANPIHRRLMLKNVPEDPQALVAAVEIQGKQMARL